MYNSVLREKLGTCQLKVPFVFTLVYQVILI
uniref:Uncharacterized protein n=1 Tax=Rhizophora mucronata TaxID=61149 RepID=A0A2P2LJ32_RHIMU